MKDITYGQIAAEKLREMPRKHFIQKLQQFVGIGNPSIENWRETAVLSSTTYSTAPELHPKTDSILSYAGDSEIQLLRDGRFCCIINKTQHIYEHFRDAELALFESLNK